jgi:carbon monoxide dehydrogenase subunit G
MISIKEQIEVPADIDFVWKIVSDPYEVVGCLPGASITSRNENGSYEGTIAVKFGPTNITFQSVVTLELNAETHEGRLTSRAKDKGGRTRSSATVDFSIKPSAKGSVVDVNGGVEVTGPLAGMVENGATFVIKRMVTTFGERLTEKCTVKPAQPEVKSEPAAAVPAATGFRAFLQKLCALLGLKRK